MDGMEGVGGKVAGSAPPGQEARQEAEDISSWSASPIRTDA